MSPSRFTDERLLRDYAIAPSQKKKIVQVAFSSRVPLPNKSRSPRSVIERTHPAHLNLILKFISTWAQGQVSPKEIHSHIRKGPERVQTLPCTPRPKGQTSRPFLPLLSFFATPLRLPRTPLSPLAPRTDCTYLQPTDQAAPRRSRQSAPAPVTSSRRRRPCGWSAPAGGGAQAGPRGRGAGSRAARRGVEGAGWRGRERSALG